MIKIFCMQKEESDILNDWIIYHKYLFGAENIHIIDHSSKDDSLDIIKSHGVKCRTYDGPFCNKARELSAWMSDERKGCEFLVPLDADEFIVFNSDDTFITEKDHVLDEFSSLEKVKSRNHNDIKFKFKQYDALSKFDLNNPIDDLSTFRENNLSTRGIRRRKTFFPSETFEYTDQGNHTGNITSGTSSFYLTDLAILHYKIRGFDHFLKKYGRWQESYGTTSPELGKPWKDGYDAIRKGNSYAIRHFLNLSKGDSPFEILCLRDQIKSLRKG